MKIKKIFNVALIIFVLASIVFFINDINKTSNSADSDKSVNANTQVNSKEKPDRLIVYYFHGTSRCPSCIKIESFSEQAVKEGFVKELKNGKIVWKVINTDEPENTHFTKDYKLYTKSLIVVGMKDNKQIKWKNLEKVWDLLGNKEDFIKYVQNEIRGYLDNK